MDRLDLFRACAHDRDEQLWREFLERFGPLIRSFAKRFFCERGSNHAEADSSLSDILHNVTVRLIDHDCQVMKNFRGTTENELIAYLAIITQSAISDDLRHHSAVKRPKIEDGRAQDAPRRPVADRPENPWRLHETEVRVLIQELRSMSKRARKQRLNHFPARDQLIFELYFLEGLSVYEIASCQGIGLAKTTIEEALARMLAHVRTAAAQGRGKQA